jgi:hypothetical protein
MCFFCCGEKRVDWLRLCVIIKSLIAICVYYERFGITYEVFPLDSSNDPFGYAGANNAQCNRTCKGGSIPIGQEFQKSAQTAACTTDKAEMQDTAVPAHNLVCDPSDQGEKQQSQNKISHGPPPSSVS